MEIIIFSILGILIVLTTILMVKKGMVKITRDTRNKKILHFLLYGFLF